MSDMSPDANQSCVVLPTAGPAFTHTMRKSGNKKKKQTQRLRQGWNHKERDQKRCPWSFSEREISEIWFSLPGGDPLTGFPENTAANGSILVFFLLDVMLFFKHWFVGVFPKSSAAHLSRNLGGLFQAHIPQSLEPDWKSWHNAGWDYNPSAAVSHIKHS